MPAPSGPPPAFDNSLRHHSQYLVTSKDPNRPRCIAPPHPPGTLDAVIIRPLGPNSRQVVNPGVHRKTVRNAHRRLRAEEYAC